MDILLCQLLQLARKVIIGDFTPICRALLMFLTHHLCNQSFVLSDIWSQDGKRITNY